MMSSRFFLIVVSCFFFTRVNSQNIDSIAYKKVEDTLKVIEKFLDDANSDPQLKRVSAIAFLLKISKIPYEGKVTFIGTEFPSKGFYTKCKDWFVANKGKLMWDVKQNKIVMRE